MKISQYNPSHQQAKELISHDHIDKVFGKIEHLVMIKTIKTLGNPRIAGNKLNLINNRKSFRLLFLLLLMNLL